MTAGSVLHWYDFICPFCYIAQDRNRILRDAGITVVELPMQIHPEIGPEGASAGPRVGPMYDNLASQAEEAGLELNWSPRIPYSRFALAAAEAVRTGRPESHQAFSEAIFHAYFALGHDIGDQTVIARCAEDVGIDPAIFGPDRADADLRYAEGQAHEHHVTATPSWLVVGQLVRGLQSRAYFQTLVSKI